MPVIILACEVAIMMYTYDADDVVVTADGTVLCCRAALEARKLPRFALAELGHHFTEIWVSL